jgi:hypothetical protein
MHTVYPSTLLRRALGADALVSGAVAALQLAAAGALADLLALPRALLVETGVFLACYTVLLVVLARSERVWRPLVLVIVAGNVGWAIACVGVIAAGVVQPSALGVAFVAVQAVAVLGFAALEGLGLKASRPAAGGHAARA